MNFVKERIVFVFFFFLYLYEIMDVRKTYCGSHFTIHVSEIMLYTLNSYSAVCQLCLHKAGKYFKKC